MIQKNILSIKNKNIIEEFCKCVIEYTNNQYNKKFENLEEIDEWLIETEKNQLGISKEIRQYFSNSTEIKEKIISSILGEIETFFEKKFILHDTVRLRTTMKDFDYLVSRLHQDSALWPTKPYFTNVWIPLVDITKDLAPICLYEGNLKNEILPHIKNEYDQYEIVDLHLLKRLKKDIIEINKGEVLLFSPSLVHCSLPNLTKKIRWSFDFRLIEV